MKRRAPLPVLLLTAGLLAAAGALADTLHSGDRIAATPTAIPGASFDTLLPGVIGGLAAHPDGRIAVLARQELVLLGAKGEIAQRRALPGPAKAVGFGAETSLVAELAHGSAVLGQRDLFTRGWDGAAAAGAPVQPVALPFGGFVFARGNQIVFADGEGREIRRLQLSTDLEIRMLRVLPQQGVLALASRGIAETALVHCAWGERATVRAVARGKRSDAWLGATHAELALDDGSLVRIAVDTGAIARTSLPDDAYAVTAFRHGRGVGIVRGQLVVFRREGERMRAGAPFGPAITRTDAGMVVPRVLVAGTADAEPLWILTNDGALWQADDVDPRPSGGMRCEASATAFLAATPGRAVIACQNRVVSVARAGAASAPGSDAGFSW